MPLDEELKLCDLAIKNNLVTLAQVMECQEIQKQIAELGTSKSLIDILLEKNYLTKEQLSTLRRTTRPRSRELGDFELISKLGEGGMGTVYKARQKHMDRLVALKLLSPRLSRDKKFLERFYREARAVARLNHINIVQAYDSGEVEGYHYYAMEYVDGQDLHRLIKHRRVIPEKEALHITVQIARALQHASGHNIVHRDVKPLNILFTQEGVAKLSDLGLAKSTAGEDISLTQTGMSVGTPDYISPEQARGEKEVDIRSDIYSLGTTLYHMVTGEPPFKGSTAAVIMTKHLTEEISSPLEKNPDLSEEVCQVIEKMMAKKREDRYQTPKELLDDLDLVIDDRKPSSAILEAGKSSVRHLAPSVKQAIRQRRLPPPEISRPRVRPGVRALSRARKSPLPILIGVGIAIVLVIIILIVVNQPTDKTPPSPPVRTGAPVPGTEVQPKAPKPAPISPVADKPDSKRENQAKKLFQGLETLISLSAWWEAIDILGQLNELRDTALVKEKEDELNRQSTRCISEADKIIQRISTLGNELNQLERQGNWAEALKTARQIEKIYKRYDTSFDKYKVKDYMVKKNTLRKVLERVPKEIEVTEKIDQAETLAKQKKFLIDAETAYQEILANYSETKTVKKKHSFLKKALQGIQTKIKSASKIAFVSKRHGNPEIYVYVMYEDGGILTRLTDDRADDGLPRWSPDGQKIAFVSKRDGNWEIYVMDADGKNQTRLTDNGAEDGAPCWSPDGQKIAFASKRDGNWEIYVMPASPSGGDEDRRTLTRLTDNRVRDGCPSWSPDGKKIAFVSIRDGNWEIYVMPASPSGGDAGGKNQTRLTNNPTADGYPCWSPDGQKIAFASDIDGKGNWEIYVMPASPSGGDTNRRIQKRLTKGRAEDSHPCWSPDGKKIAFASNRDGNFKIYVMDEDGKNQRRLIESRAEDKYPSWSPAGR